MSKRQYAIGDTVLNNWRLVKKVGQGSFGTVYEAHREEFGITYKAAIKIIRIPYDESEIYSAKAEGMSEESIADYYRGIASEIVQEFVLMAKLKGTTNIVSYEDHAVVEDKEEIGFDILIRMELLQPMLVHMNANRMTQADVARIGIDICRALEVCQKHNIIHRDIKPENMFVSGHGDFVLGDFGIARTAEKTLGNMSKKGTYTYMAPEVYREDMYGPNVDIYSLGIVMYRLLNFNRTPFLPLPPSNITHNDRELALIRRFSGEEIPGPVNAEEGLSRIVLKACAYDPKVRYSNPREMRHALERIFAELETEKTEAAYASPALAGHDETNAEVSRTWKDSEEEITQRTRVERSYAGGASRTGKFANTGNGHSAQHSQHRKKTSNRKKILPAILLAVCCVGVLGILSMGLSGRDKDESLKSGETVPAAAEEIAPSTVTIGGGSYPADTMQLRLGRFGSGDLDSVKQFSQLETVVVFNDGSGSDFSQLKSYCDRSNISFKTEIAGNLIGKEEQSIVLENVTEEDVSLFHLLADKEQILLREPEISADTVLGLEELLSETEVCWESYIGDTLYSNINIAEKLDLSGNRMESLQSLEEQLTYFPTVNEVYLGTIPFDNEEVASFRDRMKDNCKVVWDVSCGDNLTLRTDAESLSPVKSGLSRFTDSDAHNLRYCNEMKAIDLGHMMITNIEFVKFMPELKYFSISWTEVNNIAPIANCKELVFLEMVHTGVTDFSPLISCTLLEDLNIIDTNADSATISKITSLKNLLVSNWSMEEVSSTIHQCPDIVLSVFDVTPSSWRNLKNYYDMRELLGRSDLPEERAEETEVQPASQKTAGLGKIVNTESGVNVRSGAGTDYPALGKILPNTRVEILETTVVAGTQWGRTEMGWISMVYVELVDDGSLGENSAVPMQYIGKVVNSPHLNVRTNPSTQATLVGSLEEGADLAIYETVIAEGMAWGRCDMGWVYLYYVDLNPTDDAYIDARLVYNDNTIAYSDIRCSEVRGTYSKMTVINIMEYDGRMAKTDLGWVLTDNLI